MQSFLGIVNYLMKLSPMTAEVFEPVRRLTSVNDVWKWNRLYQEVYEKAHLLVKGDMCMKYYGVIKSLYLETDESGVGLGSTLPQVRDDLSCGYKEVPGNAGGSRTIKGEKH